VFLTCCYCVANVNGTCIATSSDNRVVALWLQVSSFSSGFILGMKGIATFCHHRIVACGFSDGRVKVWGRGLRGRAGGVGDVACGIALRPHKSIVRQVCVSRAIYACVCVCVCVCVYIYIYIYIYIFIFISMLRRLIG
jgi:hypothetical protein